jgi:hypothetical protein
MLKRAAVEAKRPEDEIAAAATDDFGPCSHAETPTRLLERPRKRAAERILHRSQL